MLYGWLYNRSGGVAVSVVFYHALGNLGRVVFAVEDSDLAIEGVDVVELIDFGVEALVVVVIILAARDLMLQRFPNLEGVKKST